MIMFDWPMDLAQNFCIMVTLLEFDKQLVKELMFY